MQHFLLSKLKISIFFLCMTIAPTLSIAKKSVSPCLQIGQWKIPSNGSRISGKALLDNLSKRPVIMLGETHDSEEHHMWQLHVLSALYGQNQNMVIGFESFHRSQQPILNRWTRGELSKNKFLELTRWNEVWGYDPELYMPLFQFARMHRVPMIALNIERSLIRKISRYGWESIPEDQRGGISTPFPPSKDYIHFLSNTFALHSNIEAKDSTQRKVDNKKLSRFIEAQTVWDRAMAEAIAKASSADDSPLVVAIVGSGHIKYGYGIPHQLANMGIKKGAVLLPWDKKRSCDELKTSKGIPIAHAVFGIDKLPKQKKPYRPLLGVQIKTATNNIVVTKVTKGSVAKLAGLQESDLIIQAAGKKISTAEEFVEIVGNQSPGTYLPLLILRNGEEVVIIAKFPPLSKGNNRR